MLTRISFFHNGFERHLVLGTESLWLPICVFHLVVCAFHFRAALVR